METFRKPHNEVKITPFLPSTQNPLMAFMGGFALRKYYCSKYNYSRVIHTAEPGYSSFIGDRIMPLNLFYYLFY